ncbi:MAG: glycosyltransferase N-terminal domain-containing protein [Verrucomicrobiota bacterium]
MSFRLVVLLYNLLLPGVFLLTAPFYLSKMARRGKVRRHFGQRLGRYRDSIEPWLERQQGDPLWIHAVSVGEVLLALKMVKKLHEQNPQLPIALSCTTSTGFDVALSKYDSPHFHVLYRPIDFPIPVRGAFQALRPKALVLVESEIWPNTLSEAKRREVPVFLVNARLSPRSEKRFRKARALSRPLFEQLHQVQTQTEEDIERWANLGVPSDRLLHTGSIKFDQEALAPPEEQITAFRQILSKLRPPGDDGPILLAGSTHPGEEKLLAQAFETIREKIPRAFLILVPRHFERAQEVVAAVQSETTLHPLRKTEFSASTEIREPAPRDLSSSRHHRRAPCLVFPRRSRVCGKNLSLGRRSESR